MAVRGRRIDDSKRAEIVADILTGAPNTEIATRHGVSHTLVQNIQREPEYAEILREVHLERARTHDFGQKVDDMTDRMFAAVNSVADQLCDREWLSRHSPDQIAALYAHIARNLLRIIASRAVATDQGATGYDVAQQLDPTQPAEAPSDPSK